MDGCVLCGGVWCMVFGVAWCGMVFSCVVWTVWVVRVGLVRQVWVMWGMRVVQLMRMVRVMWVGRVVPEVWQCGGRERCGWY